MCDGVRLLFIHALSPLHAGTGQGIGVIDLPIAREKATGVPYLPGSSLKGVLRDRASSQGQGFNEDQINALFGSEKLENASALQLSDARLVLLPVRSLAGTFAYVTSPYLLERLRRDAEQARKPLPAIPENSSLTKNTGNQQRYVALTEGNALVVQGKIILEDLDFDFQTQAGDWAIKIQQLSGLNLSGRLCIVHDDVMAFLMETAPEVVARNVLDHETKTSGNLWYEESLPTESVLVSLVLAEKDRRNLYADAAKVMEALETVGHDAVVQLGGKATVGRGLCRLRMGR